MSVDDGSVAAVARFDAASCSADAIQRAAYRLSDRIAIEFRLDDGTLVCDVWGLDGAPAAPADVAAFRVSVNDYVLRQRIREETAGIRNVILAVAFSNADLNGVE